MKATSSITKLSVAILLGSAIIAFAILVNAFVRVIGNGDENSRDPKKVYDNISFIKTSGSPYIGNNSAPISIIEYIDFECPFCKDVYDNIMPRLKQEYINTNKVKFIFKSMPIASLHKTAFRKTEAAFCAYAQGGNPAFFKYHDELFKRFPMISLINIDAGR